MCHMCNMTASTYRKLSRSSLTTLSIVGTLGVETVVAHAQLRETPDHDLEVAPEELYEVRKDLTRKISDRLKEYPLMELQHVAHYLSAMQLEFQGLQEHVIHAISRRKTKELLGEDFATLSAGERMVRMFEALNQLSGTPIGDGEERNGLATLEAQLDAMLANIVATAPAPPTPSPTPAPAPPTPAPAPPAPTPAPTGSDEDEDEDEDEEESENKSLSGTGTRMPFKV